VIADEVAAYEQRGDRKGRGVFTPSLRSVANGAGSNPYNRKKEAIQQWE
jgi:hypothetical protein